MSSHLVYCSNPRQSVVVKGNMNDVKPNSSAGNPSSSCSFSPSLLLSPVSTTLNFYSVYPDSDNDYSGYNSSTTLQNCLPVGNCLLINSFNPKGRPYLITIHNGTIVLSHNGIQLQTIEGNSNINNTETTNHTYHNNNTVNDKDETEVRTHKTRLHPQKHTTHNTQ